MTACVHRYRVEEVNGTSHVSGTCSHCGYTRQFLASSEHDAPSLLMSTVSFGDTSKEKAARNRERLMASRIRSGEAQSRKAQERRQAAAQ